MEAAAADLHRRSSDDVDLGRNEFPDPPSGCGGAKYKLLSPAKLPISRSACLTIPPGLSPSSFLESPVLLSNMKAEPSPTTGTFMKPQMAQGSVGSAAYSTTTVYSNINVSDNKSSSTFEFKPHALSNMVTAEINTQRNAQSLQVQSQPQSFGTVSLVKSEVAVNSNELGFSSAARGVVASADGDSDELNQRGNSSSGVQTAQFDHKGNGPSVISSEDGYNWRKYGQKHVKGSEFPRSYYKCTHPNCEVKKLFERAHDGQITEIVYKGTHDHPKPQPSRRYNTGSIMSNQEERSDKFSSIIGRDDKSSIYGQGSNTNEPNGTPDQSPIATIDDIVEATGNRISDDADDDDPFSKRRKMEIGCIDVTPVVKPIREPRVVVQTLSEVDILDDGYRWRKYGQKVVRGNPNPRSYYKCTNAGCPVRKHVERASHDPKAVITTYEGKHNHDVPAARNSSHELVGSMAASIPARIRPEETDTISLDLGVGISSATDNRSNEQHPTAQSEQMESRSHNSNVNVAQGGTTFYGILGNGLNQFGSRENIEISTLNHSSYPYPQNMGRILTGP
ncbi:hypothetical protein F8388_017911 [Cannabis sativa]|uniref:WRKY domain-containing protein n=1 Tax=Cannabis sativa TaxID=3483 RepID=A0A7J6HHC0_CANSA|nr:hypothetical protein G4B88_027646 [Cannabis sativa]KAF4394098.1 hypothetical protein F8388_017911 [Cannabis sativa]